MDGITSERLEQALAALNDQLAMADARVHLVVVGGSGLIAIEAVARTTRDVDVVALEEDGELVSRRTAARGRSRCGEDRGS